jgi:DNA modification methylase
LFTHRGELVIDPFVGSGTTLVSARDLERNAAGFDLQQAYVDLSNKRISQHASLSESKQIALCGDARHISKYLHDNSVSLIVTSPPYANLLNRQRQNKSRRGDDRKNDQYLKIEQYSQNPQDLGTLEPDEFGLAIQGIFAGLLPLLKPKGHCVINVPDIWFNNRRYTLHIIIIEALRNAGYELRNTIIWDRTNIVNKVGIFGWPSNYITMGTTFEYLLDFWRPA